jgi:STE24 endopeptidase
MISPTLIVILALIVGFFLLNSWIHWLNLNAARPEIPPEFQEVYDADTYAKSQQYLKEHTKTDLVTDTIQTAATVAFILLGGFSWVHRQAVEVSGDLIPQGLVFGGILIVITTVWSLPFKAYETFVLEEKYGFNRTTPKTFVLDLIKGLLLTVAIGAPLFSLLLWFFSSAGGHAWWISWLVVTLVQLVLLYLAPAYILPLFNKFEPLEDGTLRTKLERYAGEQGFQLSGLFKIDGSRRSTRANAYFTGFGKNRRIALFDTLIDKHSDDELVAILAHEVGHAKCRHIHKQLILGILSTGLMFFLLSLAIRFPGLYEAFGLPAEPPLPIYAGFIFFGFLYTPVSTLVSIFTNILSRKFEYEADAFAVATTQGPDPLISGLKKLSVDNLSNLTPHPFLVFLEYSHPPVLDRIAAMKPTASDSTFS